MRIDYIIVNCLLLPNNSTKSFLICTDFLPLLREVVADAEEFVVDATAFEEDSCRPDALDENAAATADESDWTDELNILDVSVEIVEMMFEESGWVAYLYAGEE